MKIAFAAAVVLMISSRQAYAEVVSMVCGGSMRRYLPDRMDMEIAPAAASLDIANRQIATPLGAFPITQVDDTSITFGTRSLKGILDRLTGMMNIFTRPEGDKTDMQTSMPSQVQMHSELKCSVAKRLF
jgi:hypothetical protein